MSNDFAAENSIKEAVLSARKDPVIREARRSIEARWREIKRITNRELSDGEMGNLAVMKGLRDKYPDAFEPLLDSKGREILLIKKGSYYITGDRRVIRALSERSGSQTAVSVFTQFGLVEGRGEDVMMVVDDTMDFAEMAYREEPIVNLTHSGRGIRVLVDLSDGGNRKRLKEILVATQAREGAARAVTLAKGESMRVTNLLRDL